MDRGWFEYKGINSRDMYLRIVNDISFPSPEADIEFIEVLGKDGELAVDNERLKGIDFRIPVQLRLPQNLDINTVAMEINEWLKTDIGWHPLRFCGFPKHEYTAICYEQFDIQETLRRFGRTVITFRLKPYKKKINSRMIELKNGTTLISNSNRTSKPFIKIEGTGDISLKNNGVDWLILRNVDESIIIDSEMMSVYKGDRPQFDKMNGTLRPLFPLMTPGRNKITWEGNVTKVEIDPREVVL